MSDSEEKVADPAPPVCTSVAFAPPPGCPAIPAEIQQALGHTGLPLSGLLIGVAMIVLGLTHARRAKPDPIELPTQKPR